ncbi:U2 small nuclear ribonucleoprotein A', partial [Irineochytrium annulatum]
MVKLDYEVLSEAPSFSDALKERCLDLRELKIPRIENLAITKDQHDTIDLTDNELRKLDNFPKMTRLSTLLVSNNRIHRIEPDVPTQVPNLTALVLSNNQLAELGDLEVLGGFTKLSHLSLMDNPVTLKKHYRMFLINRCPTLRVLDFRKVKDKERQEAKALFSGESGTQLAAALASATSSGADTNHTAKKLKTSHQPPGPTPEEAARIREAIKGATTLEEIERLKRQLEGG